MIPRATLEMAGPTRGVRVEAMIRATRLEVIGVVVRVNLGLPKRLRRVTRRGLALYCSY